MPSARRLSQTLGVAIHRLSPLKPLQSKPHASRTRIAVVLGAFSFFLGGVLLETTLGSRFIFFYGESYTAVGWWVFLLLLPVVGAALSNNRMRIHLRLRYPTWWVRWLLMYPVTVALATATLVIAPLGWIAALTWAAGVDTQPTIGRLVSVEQYRASVKGCDQRGKVALQEYVASICLEGISALPAKGNLPVLVVGRQSSLGLLILGITPQ